MTSSEALATLSAKNITNSTYYRYFSASEIESTLGLTGISQDVIINFTTREVISVNGFEYEGTVYYTLSDMD